MKPTVTANLFVLALLAGACGAPKTAAHPAGAHDTLAPAALGSLSNVHELDGVWLAGQPAPGDLEAAKAAGVKTVLNLRKPQEQTDFDEPAFVTGLGLAYVSLPWSGPGELTDEVFARSRELLSTARRPLLLHCASANRVGALWIPWRVLDGGIELEAAVAEAKAIGLKTPELEAKARDYVARQAKR